MDRNDTYFDRMAEPIPPAAPGGGETNKKAQKSSGRGLFFIGMVTGLGITLLLLAVVYLGFGLQAVMEHQDGPVLSQDSAVNDTLVEKLQMLESIIDQYYFLDEVSDEEIQTGIYRGMMDSLGDPYTVYYSQEELTSFMEQTNGTYYGIGAYMTQDTVTGLPMITGVIEGSPAEAADLRANDLIYEVNGESVYGKSLDEAVAMIKGEEGTQVTLTVVRENETDTLEFTLTRARVETPTVSFRMLEDGMAYIELTEFDDVSVDQFAEALAMARGSGMEGLILDLRGNPGGSLDAVVNMCRMILPEGMIVYTEDKNGVREEHTCDGTRELEVPLVVLVDGNSASASEIMAGAIKDYGIGTLVGTTTFGKGIVQQIMPFRDGSAIKITISAYYTPNGNNIHGIGIEPDVECPFDADAYYGSEDRPDNQLEKAQEVLRGLMGR